MTEIIDFLARAFARQIEAGASPEEARREAQIELQAEFGGERVYIPSLPKRQRAAQIARLNLRTTREIVSAAGISRQHAWRLRKMYGGK